MNKMQTIHPWLVWRRKILMTMKLGVCFLLCTMFQVSARVTAQNERMNFKMHDASLKTILWTLEKKSEMFFFYSVKDIEQVTGIDVVAENKTLDEILSEVLKNTGITYEVTHNTVVLRKGKVNAALPQSKTSEVTGKVTDRSGSPLPGVTILIKGTSSVACSIYSMPSVPITLAISCGSVITVVVPCGRTALANSFGLTSELSRWICASTKPGSTSLPLMSTSISPS